MNRFSLQCLCRGKRKDNEEWIEGYYIADPFAGDKSKTYICLYSEISQKSELYEVYPKSVGRIAVVPDQDREALFEGDIIDGKIRVCYFNHFVIAFDESSSSFVVTNGRSKYNLSKDFEYTVVGNAFDLMREKEKENGYKKI